MKSINQSRAFTLIELMIVVAIIGLLAVVAVPKFANLVRKSSEGSTKAGLGAIRSALTIYHADTDGGTPSDHLDCLIANAKYLPKIPKCDLPPYHVVVNTIQNNNDLGGAAIFTTDGGSWFYFNDPAVTGTDRNVGDVWVGCTHPDTKNDIWSSH